MEKSVTQRSKTLGLRMEPKKRYLAEIAARAKGMTLTDYVDWAIGQSLEKVTLRVSPEPELIYGADGEAILDEANDSETERIQNEAMSIANRADELWSESDFGRIESLSILACHLVAEEDLALIEYIHSRRDLRIEILETHRLYLEKRYKLNRAKIDSEWESIKTAFAKASKAKVK